MVNGHIFYIMFEITFYYGVEVVLSLLYIKWKTVSNVASLGKHVN